MSSISENNYYISFPRGNTQAGEIAFKDKNLDKTIWCLIYELGFQLYIGTCENRNVTVFLDLNTTVREITIVNPTSHTLNLEIIEALEKAKLEIFKTVNLTLKNNPQLQEISLSSVIEVLISSSLARTFFTIADWVSGELHLDEVEDFYLWYNLYCEKVAFLYPQEFMKLILSLKPHIEQYLRTYKSNPNPFTADKIS
jgi:hypothetical protein